MQLMDIELQEKAMHLVPGWYYFQQGTRCIAFFIGVQYPFMV